MGCFKRKLYCRWIVFHLILFFLLTPFLSSCGGGGGGSDADTPPVDATASGQAADNQSQSAETAINEAVAAAAALQEGRELIDFYFFNLSPTSAEIDTFVNDHPDDAIALLEDLQALATEAQTASEALVTAVDELKAQEAIVADLIEASQSRAAVPAQSRPRGLVTGGLVILTLLGTAAAVGKGASDAMHACDHLPYCSAPWPSPLDENAYPSFNDCMRWQAESLECIIKQWPTAAAEGVKATITTGVTTVGSWASGTAGYKKIKFLFDAYGTYDSADGVRKGIGIRRCDQRAPNLAPDALYTGTRQLSDVTYEELTAEDIYIGTSEAGMFHNVPEGDWTFLLFEDGYLRTETGCIDCKGPSPVDAHVTMIPLEALEDDDGDGYSEYTGDCDNLDSRIHPGVTEVCGDGIDNDCNGLTDCADDACAADAACEEDADDGADDSGGELLSVSVSIPGVYGFSPNFKAITQGSCSEIATPVPTIFATSGGPFSDPLTNDTLSVNLNNDMDTGTWGLGFGPCETPHVFFTTHDILNEDDGTPVTFYSTSGSVTLERYGTALGEPLKGSFSVQVEGDQQLCPTADCEDERVITGTISGRFDGVISNRIQ